MQAGQSAGGHRQRGFVLLELAIAGLIALLFAVWAAGAWKRDMQQAGVNAHHAWMDGVRAAAQRYLQRYDDRLTPDSPAAALADAGYADWRSPSIAEFKADGLLPQGYPETGPMRARADITVGPVSGCQTDCVLQALVHGVLWRDGDGGNYGWRALASQWLLAAGGQGGQVSSNAPQFVRGPSFSWKNPPREGVQPLPEGTVALLAAGLSGKEDYLRVRDKRDPDFQGGMRVKGDIGTEGSVSASAYLSIGARAVRAAACPEEGVIAQEQAGGLLFCRYGSWRTAPGAGGGFSTNSRHGCMTPEKTSTANPVTKGCWCPAGYVMLRISDSGVASASEASGRTIGYLCVD